MKKIIHRASDRGFADHGWLRAAHSFSFGSYSDEQKSHFGLLRVLNDDIVAPAKGFGMHSHDNMEIITIPLQGILAHKDSIGSAGTISVGEVQIMSAGSGIRHSEFNASETEDVNLLQIWIFPKERNIQPRYEQKNFGTAVRNIIRPLISPDGGKGTMTINQNAWLSLAEFDEEKMVNYVLNHPGNGVYFFVLEGKATVDNDKLNKRDSAGIADVEEVNIQADAGAKILLIEVPMD